MSLFVSQSQSRIRPVGKNIERMKVNRDFQLVPAAIGAGPSMATSFDTALHRHYNKRT
jgi:hypothetical protein